MLANKILNQWNPYSIEEISITTTSKKRRKIKKIPAISLDKLPKHALRLSLYGLRWIMLAVVAYVLISIIILLATQGFGFITQIVTFGTGGFFAGFMGYFGLIFAKSTMEMLNKHVKEKKIFWFSLKFFICFSDFVFCSMKLPAFWLKSMLPRLFECFSSENMLIVIICKNYFLSVNCEQLTFFIYNFSKDDDRFSS